MKKTLILALLFVLLGGGAWYVISQKNAPKSTTVKPEMDFSVPNTDEIGKIFIANRKLKTATLERKGDEWIYNGTWKARPDAINTLLQTIRYVTVRQTTPLAAEDHMVKTVATDGIKVEIYDRKGQKMKCYYIGGVTNDERGTYAILEGHESPFAVHLPGFVGQIRVRYMVGDDNWRDRTVFAEKAEQIQSVSVEYPSRRSDSFRLEKTKDGTYEVAPLFSTTAKKSSRMRKGFAEAYLVQFEKLSAEAFENNNPERDSVSNLVPFAIVTLKNETNTEQKVRFWPLEIKRTPDTDQAYIERYFAEKAEDFYLVHYLAYGGMFKTYSFFFE
jgi:Domain of unknown function (DUF4340)